jgi:hypothetical protein
VKIPRSRQFPETDISEGEGMLRLNRQAKSFVKLARRTIAETGILEPEDLQSMIAASPNDFFAELSEDVTLLAQKVQPIDVVDDRMDLLAVDRDGGSVIIELKRGNHRVHLLQALVYAGMLAKLEASTFVELVTKFANSPTARIEEILENFVDGGVNAVNQTQRIILIGEEFDYSTLVTVEWLSEQHGVDIRCYRLRLAVDGTGEFLSCERVYPPTELTDLAIRAPRRQSTERTPGYNDLDKDLVNVENKAIVKFFRDEIERGRAAYPQRRVLVWRQRNDRRFWVRARNQFAYGFQLGRFEGDLEFWRATLGADAVSDIAVVQNGRTVRFRLRTPHQVDAFREAINNLLVNKVFTKSLQDDESDEEEAPKAQT